MIYFPHIMTYGLLWWFSGQRAHLLFKRSEFESQRNFQLLLSLWNLNVTIFAVDLIRPDHKIEQFCLKKLIKKLLHHSRPLYFYFRLFCKQLTVSIV